MKKNHVNYFTFPKTDITNTAAILFILPPYKAANNDNIGMFASSELYSVDRVSLV